MDRRASPLQLRLFGGIELRSDRAPDAPPPGRKVRALLAYLALSPDLPCPREKLMALLWSDRAEEQARASLRQALTDLRHALGEPSPLRTEQDTVSLDSSDIVVDAVEFPRLIKAGKLAEAAALYRGPLLDGHGVRDDAYEDWLRIERSRLHDLAIDVLHRLAASQSGDAAIKTAQRLLQLDPAREETHRLLMRLYASAGQRAQALRQYRLCRDSLQREVQTKPDAETERLYRQIQDETAPVSVAEPTVSLPSQPRLSEGRPSMGAPAASPRIEMSGQSKPSLAVLPLVNLSADPTQQYLSDGITEDIITELSRYRELLVIARNSSFRYRDRSHDMKRVGQELGVEYLVDGSLRKAGDRIRVTAQLIEATTGIHLWAERYDRELADIFAVQDEVSQTVASTLVGQIERSHANRARRRPTESWAAYDFVLQAREYALQYDTQTAETLLNRAIEMDPRYALAFGRLAQVYLVQYFDDLRDETLQKALSAAQKGLSLNDEDPDCQCAAGTVQIWFGRFELAEMHFDRAISLNPNSADFIMKRATVLARVGRTTEALAALDMGALRDPHLPPWYWETRSVALFVERRYDDVIKSTILKNPLKYYDHAYLAAAYAYLRRDEEARAAAAEVLRLQPDFSIRLYSKQEPYKDPADLEHLLQGLHKAGLPE